MHKSCLLRAVHLNSGPSTLALARRITIAIIIIIIIIIIITCRFVLHLLTSAIEQGLVNSNIQVGKMSLLSS